MEAIKNEIKRIEMRMEISQERLDRAVSEFKDAAGKYGAYEIETFVPGYVDEIARCRAELSKLDEEKKMLEYLLKQQEMK